MKNEKYDKLWRQSMARLSPAEIGVGQDKAPAAQLREELLQGIACMLASEPDVADPERYLRDAEWIQESEMYLEILNEVASSAVEGDYASSARGFHRLASMSPISADKAESFRKLAEEYSDMADKVAAALISAVRSAAEANRKTARDSQVPGVGVSIESKSLDVAAKEIDEFIADTPELTVAYRKLRETGPLTSEQRRQVIAEIQSLWEAWVIKRQNKNI